MTHRAPPTKGPASNVEWQAWAKRDPLFAVATCPEKDKGGAHPWTDDAFYDLGRSDWYDFHRRWCRFGVNYESCAEIGCGAGRITRFLAADFQSVHAFDISAEMLEYAQRHVPGGNVHFYLSNGAEIGLPDGSVTSVFSCHVFQHFDSLTAARSYFQECQRVLVPGGTIMIHLPIHCWPYVSWWFELGYRLDKRLSDLKAALNRLLIQAGVFRPLMRRLTYPLEWFYTELPRLGFAEVEVAVIAPTSSHDPHPFVLARTGLAGSARRELEIAAATPRPLESAGSGQRLAS